MKARLTTQSLVEAGGPRMCLGLVPARPVVREFYLGISGRLDSRYPGEVIRSADETDLIANEIDEAMEKFADYCLCLGCQWVFSLRVRKSNDRVVVTGDAYVRAE